VRTLAAFVAGALLALVAGATWSGCGCDSADVVPIAEGAYELVDPAPAAYVGYTLTYARGAGTVHEHFTRNGVMHDTVYAVTSTVP